MTGSNYYLSIRFREKSLRVTHHTFYHRKDQPLTLIETQVPFRLISLLLTMISNIRLGPIEKITLDRRKGSLVFLDARHYCLDG